VELAADVGLRPFPFFKPGKQQEPFASGEK
jgi:hypothetical protein